MGKLYALLAVGLACALLESSLAEQCGYQVGGATCPGCLCCSGSGFCGNTTAHCDPAQGCQSQCWSGDLSSVITQSQFELMLRHRNDAVCNATNFYTYDAFITAAKAFDGFGTTGDLDTRKKEIAAFFAQSSHETSGWWEGAADGPYTWGYCFKEDAVKLDYCVHSRPWPCVPGKQYYGRGPLKLYFNYNYGAAGEAIGVDLLNNPELVVADPVIAFKTAIWFWMTPAESAKPSCHDAITGGWTPSAADQAAGRVPGFGVTTNILNGAWECGHGSTQEDKDREGFYITYCPILGTSPGMNIDCDAQLPFGWSDKPVHLPK